MGGARKTRIEKLGRRVQEFVDLRLDENWRRGCRLVDICKELEIKFGEKIPPTTLRTYKARRWIPQVLEVGALQGIVQVIRKALGPDAVSDAAQSRILQALHEAFSHGARVNPEFLLREQRLWADHDLRRMALERTARRLERSARERLQARTGSKNRKAVGDEKADPAEIRQRIRGIFGLPDDRNTRGADSLAAARPGQAGTTAGPSGSGSAPPVPGKVAPR